ncbi:hypothetical protein NDU88_001455 [Pleurodeles waltl]|uniref:Uncharacterized protein n=1 Tax=Pleurodeles waltl TaxID=8319 RepID=A0AAV7WKX6_PLEWA|nr:hypothetical protein NDU88_001455 [Pleurodeles waltl]
MFPVTTEKQLARVLPIGQPASISVGPVVPVPRGGAERLGRRVCCGRARTRAVCGPEAAASGNPRDRGITVGAGCRLLPRPQARQLALRCWCSAEVPSGGRRRSSRARMGPVCRLETAAPRDPPGGVACCPGGGAPT